MIQVLVSESLVEGEKKEDSIAHLESCFLRILSNHTAGSPTQEGLLWTHLCPREIASLLFEQDGLRVSHGCIKRLLRKHGYRRRKQSKCLATGTDAGRDLQFKFICDLVLLVSLHNPVLSIDTKKKEVLGNLYRAGKCYCNQSPKVLDHDYSHLAEGKVVPHGIYDLRLNQGYMSIGTNHETADFIGAHLEWWWSHYGIHQYPEAHYLKILCEAGGANSYRSPLFKKR